MLIMVTTRSTGANGTAAAVSKALIKQLHSARKEAPMASETDNVPMSTFSIRIPVAKKECIGRLAQVTQRAGLSRC